ncbi:MAG: hypothetical protein FWG25_02220, partial [Promicromonosporaceae bacterium]|nr:hypothetical protein [Promicromonosporaceae bacterium]
AGAGSGHYEYGVWPPVTPVAGETFLVGCAQNWAAGEGWADMAETWARPHNGDSPAHNLGAFEFRIAVSAAQSIGTSGISDDDDGGGTPIGSITLENPNPDPVDLASVTVFAHPGISVSTADGLALVAGPQVTTGAQQGLVSWTFPPVPSAEGDPTPAWFPAADKSGPALIHLDLTWAADNFVDPDPESHPELVRVVVVYATEESDPVVLASGELDWLGNAQVTGQHVVLTDTYGEFATANAAHPDWVAELGGLLLDATDHLNTQYYQYAAQRGSDVDANGQDVDSYINTASLGALCPVESVEPVEPIGADDTTEEWELCDAEPLAEETAEVRLNRGLDLQLESALIGKFQRAYRWQIDKFICQAYRADGACDVWGKEATHFPDADGNSSFDYRIEVTPQGFTDSDWVAQGTVTVTNPNPHPVRLAHLTDASGLVTGFGITLSENAFIDAFALPHPDDPVIPDYLVIPDYSVSWDSDDSVVPDQFVTPDHVGIPDPDPESPLSAVSPAIWDFDQPVILDYSVTPDAHDFVIPDPDRVSPLSDDASVILRDDDAIVVLQDDAFVIVPADVSVVRSFDDATPPDESATSGPVFSKCRIGNGMTEVAPGSHQLPITCEIQGAERPGLAPDASIGLHWIASDAWSEHGAIVVPLIAGEELAWAETVTGGVVAVVDDFAGTVPNPLPTITLTGPGEVANGRLTCTFDDDATPCRFEYSLSLAGPWPEAEVQYVNVACLSPVDGDDSECTTFPPVPPVARIRQPLAFAAEVKGTWTWSLDKWVRPHCPEGATCEDWRDDLYLTDVEPDSDVRADYRIEVFVDRALAGRFPIENLLEVPIRPGELGVTITAPAYLVLSVGGIPGALSSVASGSERVWTFAPDVEIAGLATLEVLVGEDPAVSIPQTGIPTVTVAAAGRTLASFEFPELVMRQLRYNLLWDVYPELAREYGAKGLPVFETCFMEDVGILENCLGGSGLTAAFHNWMDAEEVRLRPGVDGVSEFTYTVDIPADHFVDGTALNIAYLVDPDWNDDARVHITFRKPPVTKPEKPGAVKPPVVKPPVVVTPVVVTPPPVVVTPPPGLVTPPGSVPPPGSVKPPTSQVTEQVVTVTPPGTRVAVEPNRVTVETADLVTTTQYKKPGMLSLTGGLPWAVLAAGLLTATSGLIATGSTIRRRRNGGEAR